jgi:hypothetical protein
MDDDMPDAGCPCRLFVLMATKGPRAVVIRRGPSRRVCTVGWDRATDTFTTGQWLKGRLYEHLSDISPDGAHLLYAAGDHKWEPKGFGTWIALSRAPYLKAIGFWPGWGAFAGGLFGAPREYWLGWKTESDGVRWPPRELRRLEERPWPGAGIYESRLLRDGWRWVQSWQRIPMSELIAGVLAGVRLGLDRPAATYEKSVGAGWVLRKVTHEGGSRRQGRGLFFETNCLVSLDRDREIRCGGWEWADLDGDRLVWAEAGRLWAGRTGRDGLRDAILLHDFRSMTFEPIEAPY